MLQSAQPLSEVQERPRTMRRVALLDNPSSGQTSSRRNAMVNSTLEALLREGIEVEHLTIDGPGSGSELAREAVDRGCDVVLVCGGDGTVHEVLQCLVGTGVALGVVPMGTANALASDLGLSRNPAKAINSLLRADAVDVPVGRISFRNGNGAESSRYFTVAAGVGADALLMARMDPGLKRRFGYLLYLIEAFRIWASHPFPLFQASFANGHGKLRQVEASQLLAVRIRSFGGALGRLVPGASLHANKLCLVAFKTRSRFRYMRFLLAVLAKRQTYSQDVELIAADTVECRPANGANVYVEADGEVLGHLPVRIEIAAETLTLLIPPNAEP